MAVGLAASVRADLTPWAATRVLANFPILGATTFHFFTSYPIEPSWVVRHRRIRVIPYAMAGAIALAVVLERAVSPFPGEWIPKLAFFSGISLSLVSLGIMVSQRRPASEAGVGDRADMMIVAGLVSFLPGILILLAEYFLRTPFPWYFAMLWVAFFPIASPDRPPRTAPPPSRLRASSPS